MTEETVRVHINIDPVSYRLCEETLTPSQSFEHVGTPAGFDGLSAVTIAPIPPEYIVPEGVLEVTKNGTYDVREKSGLFVDINHGISLKKYIEEGYTDITDDNLTSIGSGFFAYDTNLKTITLPALRTIYDDLNAFIGCDNLQEAYFPACDSFGSYAMRGSGVRSLTLGDVSEFGDYSLYGCRNLMKLDLSRVLQVPTLPSNAMTSTPLLARRQGEILVPAGLLSNFQAATNWARMSSIMRGV